MVKSVFLRDTVTAFDVISSVKSKLKYSEFYTVIERFAFRQALVPAE